MKKKVLLITLSLLLVFSSLAVSCAKEREEVVLHWDIALPPVTYISELAVKYSEIMTQRSDGRLQFEITFGGEAGYKLSDALHVMDEHLMDMTFAMLFQAGGDEPIFGVEVLPFLLSSWEDAETARDISRPYYQQILEGKWNCKPFVLTPVAPAQIFCKVLIESEEDFKKLKIRALDPITAEAEKAIGCTPVSVSPTELYTAAMQGTINSGLTSCTTCMESHWDEAFDYIYNVYWFNVWGGTHLINLDVWNNLPEDLQSIMLEAFEELEEEAWAGSKEYDDKARQTLVEKGMIDTGEFPPELKAWMKEQTLYISEQWAEDAGLTARELLYKITEAVK